MPDDTAHSSPPSEPTDPDLAAETAKEDADTAAARKELKHTVISDAGLKDSSQESALEVAPRVATPESDASETRNEALKEQVSSPKKKRAHDEVEDEEAADKADAKSDISTDSARDRAARAEPEKKRPRDELSAEAETTKANATVDAAVTTTAGSSPDASKVPKPPQTSAEKFQASGFGQLGQSSASGFSALAGTGTKSIFGSSAPTTSVFSAAAPAAKPTSPPTLSFGGAPSGASPFGTLAKPSTNGFGSSVFGSSSSASPWAAAGAKPLGGGFGGFGNGKALQGGKATKPFGAPDHESEGEEDDESEDGAEAGGDEDKEESKKEEVKSESDEKKPKLQKVNVDDGETGEVTLLQVRAKLFYVDKAEGRWVERGSGMLKINVPDSCVSYDEVTGAPIPGSFDASALDDDDEEEGGAGRGNKIVRLIMRQDHTHRVLLNTAILPAMAFEEKATLKSVGVLFTAFEGDEAKPVSVHLKMSAANAKSFLNEVSLVQRELQSS